jgi:hypothetical protein
LLIIKWSCLLWITNYKDWIFLTPERTVFQSYKNFKFSLNQSPAKESYASLDLKILQLKTKIATESTRCEFNLATELGATDIQPVCNFEKSDMHYVYSINFRYNRVNTIKNQQILYRVRSGFSEQYVLPDIESFGTSES